MVTTWPNSNPEFGVQRTEFFVRIESGPDSNQKLEKPASTLFINIIFVSVRCLVVILLNYGRFGW